MTDLKNPRIIWVKGLLFFMLGSLACTLIVLETLDLKIAVFLAIAIWSFCRCYYFAFYVIEHYIDSNYRFAGLLSFLKYALSKIRHDQVDSKG